VILDAVGDRGEIEAPRVGRVAAFGAQGGERLCTGAKPARLPPTGLRNFGKPEASAASASSPPDGEIGDRHEGDGDMSAASASRRVKIGFDRMRPSARPAGCRPAALSSAETASRVKRARPALRHAPERRSES